MKAILPAILALTLSTSATATELADTRHITVNGEARVAVVPDTAEFNMAVELRGTDLDALTSEMETITRKALQELKKLGIAKEELTAAQVQVYPITGPKQQHKTTGYAVKRDLRVVVRDLKRYGEVLDTALAAGITRISSVEMKSSVARDLQRQALANSVTDAKAKAEVLARAAGSKIVRVLSIQEGYSNVARHESRNLAAMADTASFEPGTLDIQAQVSVMFEIE